MTFDQVLVFHKVVELGSFRMAAAELHKTQPAISLAMKKLEEEIGAELFDRSGYRPELTTHGKAFFERSHRAVQGMHELEGLTKSFQSKEEPEISVAVDGISPMPAILKVMKNFGDRHLNTKMNLSFETLAGSEDRVLSRESQIGITHFISEKSSLEIIPITTVRMIPVMNIDTFKEKNVRSQLDLLEIDQIVISDKGKNKSSFGLLEDGKKWRLSDANFKREIILAGLGWGHMPEHYVEREIKEGSLIVLNFPDIHPRTLDVNLIRLKKNQFGPVARALWSELTTLSHGPSR